MHVYSVCACIFSMVYERYISCSDLFMQCSESKKKYSILKFNAANNVDFTKCGTVCIYY